MSKLLRIAALAALGSTAAASAGWPAALAEGIEPGLWKIAIRSISHHIVGPPQESTRCLTADQAKDVVTTFSPVARTENSTCAPIERQFADQKLTWRLVCTGRLNMELTGEFHFNDPKHYTATTTTKAVMAGQTMVDSRDLLDATWVSACQ
jgi:hypothetical protein